jgi:hypothetical protein
MFSKLFEERDKTISLLVKLGDCIGRSLRENVTLFSIDSANSGVTYLTENNKVISGNYDLEKDITLNSIKIQNAEVFQDGTEFDKFVDQKIHSFVEGIHYGEYSSSDDSFSDILSLWENRVKLGSMQQKLYDKALRLEAVENIVSTEEFQKLIEVTPQLHEFLQESFEKVSTIPEIRNAVNLSHAVSQAFDFPRLSYDNLVENKSYIVKDGKENSIYDMICRQELVKKELVESKKNFDLIWANNGSVRKLAGMIFENDEKIIGALSEALKEVPYLALASKKSLTKTFNNCLGQADGIGVSEKDVQAFASKIFEAKKEVKELFIESINEKYGVNIQNLQEGASFKSLANTQVIIFEALSRLTPKGTVLKQVLSELATSLKGKSGVETIDVNNYIHELFSSAGYSELLEENKAVSKYTKIDFKRVAKDLGDVKDLIGTLKDKAVVDQEYSSDENLDQKQMAAQEGAAEKKAAPAPEAAAPAAAPEAPAQEAPPEEPAPELPPEAASQDDMISDLSDIESMVADIAKEIGIGNKEDKE